MTECNADNWREVLEAECGIPASAWHDEGDRYRIREADDPGWVVYNLEDGGHLFVLFERGEYEASLESYDVSDLPRIVKALQASLEAVEKALAQSDESPSR